MLEITGQLPYVLSSLDRLYPSVNYEVSTVKSVGQDGSTPVSASFSEREMTLAFTVAASDRQPAPRAGGLCAGGAESHCSGMADARYAAGCPSDCGAP